MTYAERNRLDAYADALMTEVAEMPPKQAGRASALAFKARRMAREMQPADPTIVFMPRSALRLYGGGWLVDHIRRTRPGAIVSR